MRINKVFRIALSAVLLLASILFIGASDGTAKLMPDTNGNAQAAPNNTAASGNTGSNRQKREEPDKPLSDILKEKGIDSLDSGTEIKVDKSEHILSIVYNGTTLKSYHVELGDGGMEDKVMSGDHKTPEGTFYVTDKQSMDPPDYYLGSRWLGIGYPNVEDADRGLNQGLIDRQTHDEIVDAFSERATPPQETALGGDIGIHGGGTPEFGSDWTWGCIGLKNFDIEDFYDFISVGTPVVIQK